MNSFARSGLLGVLVSSVLLYASHGSAGVVALDDGSLAPDDTTNEDWFGFAVAVEEDTAVVGAWAHGALQTNGGAAYVFERSATGWGTPAKLTQADPQYDHRFGNSVALADGDILVGAHHDETDVWASGSVYVFRHDGTAWKEVQKMIPDEHVDDGRFGITMAASGTTAVFGSRAGEAYAYVREAGTWTLQQVMTADDGAGADERFGLRVAVDGDVAVIGAPDATVTEALDGAAYVFARTGSEWTQVQKLSASAGAAYDSFGNAVAIFGDTILVGSPFDDEAGSDAGAVYVFRHDGSTWSQQDKLMPTGVEAGNKFGDALSMRGDVALAGSPSDDEIATSAGAVYLLQQVAGAWVTREKIVVATSGADDGFGTAVATDGSTAIVGAPSDDHVATNVGMAYSFLLRLEDGDPCTDGEVCASGFCVDGVCCESACEGGATASCHACSVAAGSTADGFCGFASTTTECAEASCTGPGMIRAAGMCDGQGACQDGAESACAGGYACLDGACLDSCSTASECVDGYWCSEANACAVLSANGADCGGPDECSSGFCVDGVCCNEACEDGTCASGTCEALADGGTGGTGGAGGSGGASGSGGSKPAAGSGDDDDGCGCRTVGHASREGIPLVLLMAAALLTSRRRRLAR